AAQRLHAARLPYISVLTHPTTGGVFASFASLGDVHLAEPGALIGFSGPRVLEQVGGRDRDVAPKSGAAAGADASPPLRSHTAEFLLAHGMIDGVVERGRLREVLAELLSYLSPEYRLSRGRGGEHEPVRIRPGQSAWDTVQLARHAERPTA